MKLEDILSALPSRDDVASAIGIEARTSAAWDGFMPFGLFASGIVLGAGMTLLLAPKTGHDTRRDIAGKVGELGERLRQVVPQADSSPITSHVHNLA